MKGPHDDRQIDTLKAGVLEFVSCMAGNLGPERQEAVATSEVL